MGYWLGYWLGWLLIGLLNEWVGWLLVVARLVAIGSKKNHLSYHLKMYWLAVLFCILLGLGAFLMLLFIYKQSPGVLCHERRSLSPLPSTFNAAVLNPAAFTLLPEYLQTTKL